MLHTCSSWQQPAVLHISAFAAVKSAYCAATFQLHDSQMTRHACEMPLAAFRGAIMAPCFEFYAALAACHPLLQSDGSMP